MMKNKIQISLSEAFPFFNEKEKKKCEQLTKSINSLNNVFVDFSIDNSIINKEISFTYEELYSAAKRLGKATNDIDFGPEDVYNSFTTEINSIESDLDSLILQFAKKDTIEEKSTESDLYSSLGYYLEFVDPYDYIEHIQYETVISDSLLAELYFRRVKKILINILSSCIELRKLITVQSPIKKITYEYFDLIFSLKKEVEVLEFYNDKTSKYLQKRENEKKHNRYLQTLN